MASNNQKCVWVYAVGYELVHYFQTAEEADGWWAGYKVLAGDDVEGAIEQVWMFPSPPSPLSTALALASSKTNWTAIVPARAPPPPPPTPVKDIVGCCEKCAVEIVRDSDEHDNAHIIDGGDAADKFRCQRCLVDCPCDECGGGWQAQCVLCSKWAVSATMSYDDAVGEHSCCDCDPKGDVLLGEEEYICDCSVCGERIYPCGSIELGDDGDGGGCCKGCEPTLLGEEDETQQCCCDICMEVFHEDDLSCLCFNEKCGLFQKNCCKDCCAKNKCEDCGEEKQE